jgi:hypothetical protein
MILFSSYSYDHSHNNSTRSSTSKVSNSSMKPPLAGRRRRKSCSTGTNTTVSSTDSSSFFVMPRSVRFSEAEPAVGEAAQREDEEEVWFAMEYLQAARREEIKNNLRAQYFSKDSTEDSSIESETLTWRGMEDILEKVSRQDKQRHHTRAVVDKYKSQHNPTSPKAQHHLRQFSKSLSKSDRHKAAELAANDAALVDRPVRSVSPLSQLGKTVSSSIRSWSPGPASIPRHSAGARKKMFQRTRSHSMDVNLFRWTMGPSSSQDHPDLLLTSSHTLISSEAEQEQ